MNRGLKMAVARAGAATGLWSVRRSMTRSKFRIVTYHGVDERDDPVLNVDRLQTPPALFSRQIESMARAFRIVSLHEAVEQLRNTGAWPDRGLAITFDDGYRNNLEVAAPILRRAGVPATFFVTAGFVEGRSTPWWYALRSQIAANAKSEAAERVISEEARLRPMSEAERSRALCEMGVDVHAACPYPFMTSGECGKLLKMGFDIQGHGDTHASMGGESATRVAEEIRASAEFIRKLGHAPWALAYPYGHEPADSVAAQRVMAECGFIAAVTTRAGKNDATEDLVRLRRQDVHGGYDPAVLIAWLS